MRIHPGWLAIALLIFVVFGCNLSKNSNNSNNSNKNSNVNKATPLPTRNPNAEIFVSTIYMARDANGKPGTQTTSFTPGDRTIHCVITLNKAKKGTQVRFIWKIVDVAGAKDQEIRTIDVTTNSFENIVRGHLMYPKDWPVGKYGVEVYINGGLDRTIDYTIE